MDAWPTVAGSVARSDHEGCVERGRQRTLPILLTADEAADLLRTSRRAIYAMVARGQLPGVVRVRRRVLLRTDVLLHWLEQKCVPSPEESR
jgi:excisionase family DNA binding protein